MGNITNVLFGDKDLTNVLSLKIGGKSVASIKVNDEIIWPLSQQKNNYVLTPFYIGESKAEFYWYRDGVWDEGPATDLKAEVDNNGIGYEERTGCVVSGNKVVVYMLYSSSTPQPVVSKVKITATDPNGDLQSIIIQLNAYYTDGKPPEEPPDDNTGSEGSSTETCVDCGGAFSTDEVDYRTDSYVTKEGAPGVGYYCFTCSSKYN